jgi:putative acetyltransferase
MSIHQQIDLRRALESDLLVLQSLYADAVLSVTPSTYSPDQVDVWSSFAQDAVFSDFIYGVNTYVATKDAEAVGFCGVAEDGHVVSIYVSPGWVRQGIGTRLLNRVLLLHPVPTSGRYYAEASSFSLPLFQRCGFQRTGIEKAIRKGVTFERFLVERAVPNRE